MRKAVFHVPAEAMPEFVIEMTDRRLVNTVTGVTEDDEIIMEVEYDKDETSEVDELEEILETLVENIEKDDDE